MASTESAAPRPTRFEDSVCPACGCLCDDIGVGVEAGKVVEARNACPMGQDWFLRDRTEHQDHSATVAGDPRPLGVAVARATDLLKTSRSPVLVGLNGATLEDQGMAVALADRLGAAVILGHETLAMPRVRAFQRVGLVTATLGEVRERADLVIYWGVDPVRTHPRHWERFVEPPGRFRPRGRRDRFVIAVGAEPTATSRLADAFIPLNPADQLATLRGIRAQLMDYPGDPTGSGLRLGPEADHFRILFDRIRLAHYGVLFFDATLGQGPMGQAVVEEFLRLVRDQNASSRCVALSLGMPGNPSGAETVLTWQAGMPLAVDFSPGWPRPRVGDVVATLAVADAVLIVADDHTTALPVAAMERLRQLPRVVIGAEPGPFDDGADVVFRTAIPGLQVRGTFMRSDGLTLPLRPILETSRPTIGACLQAISTRLSDPS